MIPERGRKQRGKEGRKKERKKERKERRRLLNHCYQPRPVSRLHERAPYILLSFRCLGGGFGWLVTDTVLTVLDGAAN